MKKTISLYLHIPFCATRCGYCDFLTFANAAHLHEPYKNALLREIQSAHHLHNYRISTIFIGGGTPTTLAPAFLGEILQALAAYDLTSDCEITVEANPGTLDLPTLRALKSNGVNRLSMGLQAWQNKLLKRIERSHTQQTFLQNYNHARRVGFNNINIDMIFSLPSPIRQTADGFLEETLRPDQAFAQWGQGLQAVTDLQPEHLSLYSLILEENTRFYQQYEQGLLSLQSQELDRRMYHFGINYLAKKGYTHYEISNFAKARKECKHNMVYWQGGEYMAFGLGAAGYVNSERYSNQRDLDTYIRTATTVGYTHGQLIAHAETLDRTEHMGEFFYLGLRCIAGVNLSEFEKKFGVYPTDVFGDAIADNIAKGLLVQTGDNLRLSKQGLDISNQVFADFV